MLFENSGGNYTFIRGSLPFSAAALAQAGFEIVHARLVPMTLLAHGYTRVEHHLNEMGRPIAALCGMELRIPEPLSREGFDQFNRPYTEQLRRWGLGVDMVTRTNVALEGNRVEQPMLAGFYYTAPSATRELTFVLSGVPEIASRGGAAQVVARDDTSQTGLRLKLECILDVLRAHLAEMHLNWDLATAVNLYSVHDLHPLMVSALIPALGAGSSAGITWHYARPPVRGLEIEIDARAVRSEIILTGR